jgi:DNA-binding NtrC family response regulator
MMPWSSAVLPQPEKSSTVLTVNLCHEDCVSLARILVGSNWVLTGVPSCQEALTFSRIEPVSVVVCGPHMPDGSWNTLLHGLRELPDPPMVIVVSRFADECLWAEVLNLGGYDVLATPFDRSEVLRVLYLAWAARERESRQRLVVQKAPPAAERGAEPGLKWLSASSSAD